MLKSYAFDVDYNLVYTDDTIRIDVWGDGIWKPTEISQKQYEEFTGEIKIGEKYRFLNASNEQAMVNFKAPGKFQKNILQALEQEKYGPSRNKFVEANKYASPLAIITARGHPLSEFKDTHKEIIYNILTDGQREDLIYSMKEHLGKYRRDDDYFIETYLNNNFYAPCSNLEFVHSIGKELTDPMPDRKNIAFEQFVLHTKKVFTKYYGKKFMEKRKFRVGFSDDTYSNIEGLHNFIQAKKTGLMYKYPEILFRLYDTAETKARPTKFSYKNIDEEM